MGKPISAAWLLMLCLLTVACVSQNRYASLEDELTDNRARLERVRAENEQLAGQKDQLARQLEQLREEKQQVEETNRRLSAAIDALSKRAQRLRIELEKHQSVVQLQEKVIHLLDDTQQTIQSSLKEQMAAGGAEIVEMQDEVKVVLLDKILYEPGSLEIHPKGKELLKALADTVRDNPEQQLVVVGHTDSVSISDRLRKQFPTNWELSAARAAAVIRYLQYRCDLDPKRISLRAYGPYRPTASNRTEKGRRLNRRIEIIIGPAGK
jgi:chemotaxis protein MotB